MAKYRKKPVVIEAEVFKLGMEDGYQTSDSLFCAYSDEQRESHPLSEPIIRMCIPAIRTLEGWHIVSEGDYIITGIKGERYPCKPDIFELTYDKVEGDIQ